MSPVAATVRGLLPILAALALGAACEARDNGQSLVQASLEDQQETSTEEQALSSARQLGRRASIARGAKWVTHFECRRCHSAIQAVQVPQKKDCAGCHNAIRDGSLMAPPAALSKWRKRIVHFLDLPSLAGVARLREQWLKEFLLTPHDLRPSLEESMPRLPLSAEQAADIAAYLTGEALPSPPDVVPDTSDNEHHAGRKLFLEKGCGSCHHYSGLGVALPVSSEPTSSPARKLAPDLRHTRARMDRATTERWLQSPRTMAPDTLMPQPLLSSKERAQLVSFIHDAPITDPAPLPPVERLPLLERAVTFDEVSARLFRNTCWHCHSNPNFARGDGGPGNSGGFGFTGVELDLSEYETLLSGYLGPDQNRRSLFAKHASGDSYLVRALLARREEERGRYVPGVTGMPLGLPSVSAEDLQLLESWIAQGRTR